VFESPRGRQLLHPFDVSLDVPAAEAPLVSALESFQVPAPRQVVHDIGTEIKEDRKVARLEDSWYASAVQWRLRVTIVPSMNKKIA
jgi:hypothetical protein